MDFAHPHFAEPQWLWLALLGPLALLILQRYSAWAGQRLLARVASPRFLQELTRTRSPLRHGLKQALLLLSLLALGCALARPQWGQQENAGQTLGQDTVFILDCSRSMLAADVAPNRLERAKLAIREFVQRRAGGRFGLVTFAGQAFLQCPLTYDYGAFDDALSAIDDKTIPVPGTDVGRSLDEAARALSPRATQKYLVLITDGEDLEHSGVRTAEALAKQNIRVYAVGVGTPAGSEIQLINEQGRRQLLRDKNGEVVRSRLDEPTLRAIAQVTRGAYHPLGPAGEGLARIELALENLRTTSGTAPGRLQGVDRFHYPLAVGLLLLALEPLLGTRRRLGSPVVQ